MTIWFDMDGTIADLYGDCHWLEKLIAENAEPYENARPLIRMSALAYRLNRLQKAGYQIGIVSWLSKNASAEYDEKVIIAKKQWLAKHLASVKFDYVDIIKYGTPKQIGRNGILFDDEKPNRQAWGQGAYDVHDILNVLKGLK